MSVDDIFRIGGPAEPGSYRPDPTADSTEFRRLLEQLEKLSKSRAGNPDDEAGEPPSGVEGPDALKDALRRAEDDYVTAMDLRRQLEEAFRRSQS